MASRLSRLATLVYLVVLAVACAEGAPAAPPGQQQADPLLGQPQAVCGDGIKAMTEYCECPPTASVMCEGPREVTCQSLMMGTGTIYCDPNTCTYITRFCTAGAGTPGAGGNGAAAGAGSGAGSGG